MKIQETPADDNGCGWFHLSPPRTPRAARGGQVRARWAVVGAGLTGLAAARQLALNFPADEVVLLEAQEVGFGSSGRNSGFAIDLPHDIGAPDYIGDPAIARMSLKLNLFAQGVITSLVARHGIDCQLKPVGKYQAAVEDKGLRVLEAYKSGLEKLGQAYQIIEADELPAHLGTSFYRRALYTPGTLLLQPASLVKGLADSLPANVSLFERCAVTEVDYRGPITLRHAAGSVVADKLVLANNAFATQFGFLKGRLLPVFTYASMTRPLSVEEQARLGGKPVWGIIPADPFGSTLRRTPDQRLLVRNSFSFNPSGKIDARLLARAAAAQRRSFEHRFPMLPGVAFDYTWGGAMGMTRNHAGHFGELAPNVYGALGCNGLGITRGTGTGTLLADWLAGQRNELIDFLLASAGPSRNPPQPFLSLGVNASLCWGQHRAGLES
ncbi:NAD(P)/FAD-dependent oxidoreductase [Pseudomonas citronellolis]|uniref:NAD(P)/FAD-dependent oxidoreductase n=1 Tax=Pseudomonas citronellolis TaxID=53408 RepID=UPI002D7A3C90|nr:FAD-binding oxidoreductase [Pseudomonas citronellolis]WRT82185.1 FAD-binding oxidoreductase [Pseudomonas citronellolis]